MFDDIIISGEFNKGLMLYGVEKINRFSQVIGFSNFKNKYKYECFIKSGKVPSSKEVETFLIGKNPAYSMGL